VNKDYYRYLCCPKCEGDLDMHIAAEDDQGVKDGDLTCRDCGLVYPIVEYIPRFVPMDTYASSFGFEWQRFSKLRSDRYNKSTIIRDTILRRSGWDAEHLRGKLVLECGCGGGNDTEALLGMGANLVSIDLSSRSAEVTRQNNEGRGNLLVVQGDIAQLPIKKRAFDVVYCHRVIQHTPSPERSFRSMVQRAADDGEMFLHSYSTRLKSMLHYKYLLRPVTKRMDHDKVLRLLYRYGPSLYRLVGWVQSHHLKFLRRAIPFDNLDSYLAKHGAQLTDEEKFEFSLTNVFDALTPTYDIPASARTVGRWFGEAGFEAINVRRRKPVVVVASRRGM